MEDLARQLQKYTGYMLPSLVYPPISSTKLGAFVIRHSAGRKRAGYVINAWPCVNRLSSIAMAACTSFRSDRFYGLQHLWYNVVMPCFATFLRFLFCNRNKLRQRYVLHWYRLFSDLSSCIFEKPSVQKLWREKATMLMRPCLMRHPQALLQQPSAEPSKYL